MPSLSGCVPPPGRVPGGSARVGLACSCCRLLCPPKGRALGQARRPPRAAAAMPLLGAGPCLPPRRRGWAPVLFGDCVPPPGRVPGGQAWVRPAPSPPHRAGMVARHALGRPPMMGRPSGCKTARCNRPTRHRGRLGAGSVPSWGANKGSREAPSGQPQWHGASPSGMAAPRPPKAKGCAPGPGPAPPRAAAACPSRASVRPPLRRRGSGRLTRSERRRPVAGEPVCLC